MKKNIEEKINERVEMYEVKSEEIGQKLRTSVITTVSTILMAFLLVRFTDVGPSMLWMTFPTSVISIIHLVNACKINTKIIALTEFIEEEDEPEEAEVASK